MVDEIEARQAVEQRLGFVPVGSPGGLSVGGQLGNPLARDGKEWIRRPRPRCVDGKCV